LFSTPDVFTYTRNTVGYNLLWMALGLVLAVTIAICLTELWNRRLSKFFQATMLLPFFLSWVVVSYFVYSLLNMQYGVLNNVLMGLRLIQQPIQWYYEPKYWPYILTITNLWKNAGYSSIIYISAIAGLDQELYEAAAMDGASKWQQVKSITLPLLRPMMVILTVLSLGGIFKGNFDLFFNLPMGSSITYPTTMVIDTYVYNALAQNFQLGITTATGLYQSVVGCVMVVGANLLVRKISPEEALF
jgi:putative aldouronate transport system permease protein